MFEIMLERIVREEVKHLLAATGTAAQTPEPPATTPAAGDAVPRSYYELDHGEAVITTHLLCLPLLKVVLPCLI